jgi:hypothetical protein
MGIGVLMGVMVHYSWTASVFQIMLLDFCVSATDQIRGLFVDQPVGSDPGVSGILGYASLFHVFLDVGQS